MLLSEEPVEPNPALVRLTAGLGDSETLMTFWRNLRCQVLKGCGINENLENVTVWAHSCRLLHIWNAAPGNASKLTTKCAKTAQNSACKCWVVPSRPEVVPPEQLKTDPVS